MCRVLVIKDIPILQTGRQCTVIAVVAPCFAMLKRRTIWQTRDADGILAEDHQKYI